MENKEDVQLSFAREILDWPQACRFYGHRCYSGNVYSSEDKMRCKTFRYNDLGHLLKIISSWCDKNEVEIFLRYSPKSKSYWAHCEDEHANDSTRSVKPNIALMMGCLKIKRKIYGH